MMTAVCPYCRCSVDDAEREQIVCAGCGTPHHADCFAENGGCTVFGCSAAPQDEPKVSLTGADFATPLPVPALQSAGLGAPRPAPPPINEGAAAGVSASPNPTIGSILFRPTPVARPATPVSPVHVEAMADPDAKNRTTFIVLGVILGMLGAHNFYAGYKGKAFAQLGITVLTLGYAGLMSWVWAVIDICTVFQDSKGVKFRS